MNSFIDYILAHPVILIVTGAILLSVILYYLLKGFFKFIIVAFLVILAVMIGYHFYESGGKFNERMKAALLETKEQIASYIEKGKEIISKGKKIVSPDEEAGAKERQKTQKSKMEAV